jgi:hypothetical protein
MRSPLASAPRASQPQVKPPRRLGPKACEAARLALDGPANRLNAAGVVKLVDTPDLGSGGASHGGSSPSARTTGRFARVPALAYSRLCLLREELVDAGY